MRELKFRAWDSKNKKFALIGFDILGETTVFDLCKQYQLEEALELEISQFVQTDKNGKDIYEGDIVKWRKRCYDWDKPEGEEMYFVDKIGRVEYVGHQFFITGESFGWEGEELWDWNQLEVIGNIYENSELLEEC